MHRTEDVSYSAGRADLVNGNVSASETLGKSVDGTETDGQYGGVAFHLFGFSGSVSFLDQRALFVDFQQLHTGEHVDLVLLQHGLEHHLAAWVRTSRPSPRA